MTQQSECNRLHKSILDPEVHARLIEEIDEHARRAGIPKRFIEQSMIGTCGEQELDYFHGYRTNTANGIYGLCYIGVSHVERMMYMAGAFTRNFVLAQLFTMNNLLEAIREGDTPNPSVLLIPSFQMTVDKTAALTPYQVTMLYSLLEDRMINERQTIIGIDSTADLKAKYGSHFADLINNHYIKVTS